MTLLIPLTILLASAPLSAEIDQAPVTGQAFSHDARPDVDSAAGRYRLKGDQSLRPKSIVDDGSKTYIEWGLEQSIPAVLGIGPTGEEEVVAGYMRGGIFTIDRVYPQLVFRIDRQKTVATREIEGRKP